MPEGDIKNIGDYVIPVNVHPQVSFEINVSVIAEALVPSLEEALDAADNTDQQQTASTENVESDSISEVVE